MRKAIAMTVGIIILLIVIALIIYLLNHYSIITLGDIDVFLQNKLEQIQQWWNLQTTPTV